MCTTGLFAALVAVLVAVLTSGVLISFYRALE